MVKEGAVLAFAEEERFSRRRHNEGSRSSTKSVAYCLASAGISLSDVEAIAISWNPRWPEPLTANALDFALLRSIPGIGAVLAATILYEIHDIHRFPSVQHFCSYARLVKPQKTSAGKTTGGGGAKIGNQHLKWAFSEAAVLFIRNHDDGKRYYERLQKRFSKAKAISIIAHKLGRCVYFILLRQKAWDAETLALAA